MGLKQVDVGSCGDIALLYVLVVAYICIYVVKREIGEQGGGWVHGSF